MYSVKDHGESTKPPHIAPYITYPVCIDFFFTGLYSRKQLVLNWIMKLDFFVWTQTLTLLQNVLIH